MLNTNNSQAWQPQNTIPIMNIENTDSISAPQAIFQKEKEKPDYLHLMYSALNYGIQNIIKNHPSLQDRIIHINTPIKYDYERTLPPAKTKFLDEDVVNDKIKNAIPKVIQAIEKALSSNHKTAIIWSKSPEKYQEEMEKRSVIKGVRNYIAHTDLIIVNEGKVYLPLNFIFLQDTKILSETLQEKYGSSYFAGAEVNNHNMKATMPQKDFISCGAFALKFTEILLTRNEEIQIAESGNVILPESCRDYFQRNTQSYGGSSCKNAEEVDEIRKKLWQEQPITR